MPPPKYRRNHIISRNVIVKLNFQVSVSRLAVGSRLFHVFLMGIILRNTCNRVNSM